jgi:PAS domain S-box-containing protein
MTEPFTASEILDASPDIIGVVTPEGKVEYLNRAASELLGYGMEVLQESPWDRVVHPDDRAQMAQLWQVVLTSYDTTEARYRVRHADGRFIWLDSRMRPVRSDRGRSPLRIAIVAREATSQIELERALQAAKEEAERADRAKSDFLSRMSHELRTPLNAILGFNQLLELDDLAPDQRESVNEIRRGGTHLLELINEVLDISRIEAGKLSLEIEPVHAGTLIEESVAMVGPLAAERHMSLEVVVPGWDVYVSANAQRLRQVLLNLLSNAIKYGKDGGKVVFRCAAAGHGPVRFEVEDDGVGIAPEHMGRLFSPFDRLEAERSDVPGAGLGLALTKRLVEVMGGDISVESTPGEGSTFIVELPGAPGAADGPASAREGGSFEVLYIEDNPANLRLVERLLSKRRPNVRLTTATTGAEGLELARSQRPQTILLDVNLPDIQGGEVLARLKEDPRTKAIPVVIVSADAGPDQIAGMREGGAADYVTKPIDVDRLLGVLDSSFARSEVREA